jgi:hypothetical protein
MSGTPPKVQTKEQKLHIMLEYLESINDSAHTAARDSRYMYFRTDGELPDLFYAIWHCCDTIHEHVDTLLDLIREQSNRVEQNEPKTVRLFFVLFFNHCPILS